MYVYTLICYLDSIRNTGGIFMNVQQKAAALNALSRLKVCIRKENDWYIEQSTEIKNGDVLIGEYGDGATPEEAIENHWEKLAESGKIIVTDAYGDGRIERRWNGYMWA